MPCALTLRSRSVFSKSQFLSQTLRKFETIRIISHHKKVTYQVRYYQKAQESSILRLQNITKTIFIKLKWLEVIANRQRVGKTTYLSRIYPGPAPQGLIFYSIFSILNVPNKRMIFITTPYLIFVSWI